MPRAELLLAFAAATAAFAIFPGPALLYTAARTLAGGRRAGFIAVLGIHLGCYVHVLAATLGLSALFAAVPALYAALKIAGALYLVWLGLGMLLAAIRRDAAPTVAPAPKSGRRALVESIVVELLNPKVALFFLAFLPQFIDPAAAFPVWLQFLILGVIVNLAFSSADVVTVLTASVLVARLRRGSTMPRIIRAVGGATLVGLGARLATDR